MEAGKRLPLQLCQRGIEESHGGKQEGIANQYILLRKQHIRAAVSVANSQGKYYFLKVTCPEGDFLGIFAKWKWTVEPYPSAVMETAIAFVRSFIPAMARCPSETSHRDIILTATLSLNIAE